MDVRRILAALLVPLGLIDARHFILPDLITLSGIVLGLALVTRPIGAVIFGHVHQEMDCRHGDLPPFR